MRKSKPVRTKVWIYPTKEFGEEDPFRIQAQPMVGSALWEYNTSDVLKVIEGEEGEADRDELKVKLKSVFEAGIVKVENFALHASPELAKRLPVDADGFVWPKDGNELFDCLLDGSEDDQALIFSIVNTLKSHSKLSEHAAKN